MLQASFKTGLSNLFWGEGWGGEGAQAHRREEGTEFFPPPDSLLEGSLQPGKQDNECKVTGTHKQPDRGRLPFSLFVSF